MADEFLKLTNLQVAEIQINRAIRLFLDNKDYVSALTLAGAAEEILGNLLTRAGQQNALDEAVEASIAMEKLLLRNNGSEPKDVRDIANYFRNRLKHYNDNEPLGFSADYYAADMIDRAMQNYFKVTSWETPEMIQFKEATVKLLPSNDV